MEYAYTTCVVCMYVCMCVCVYMCLHNYVQMCYLDLDVANFSRRADDGSSHQRREDVRGEVGTCVPTLDKL